MSDRKTLAALCAVAGFLLGFGVGADSQAALMGTIVVALAAGFVGDRMPKRPERS